MVHRAKSVLHRVQSLGHLAQLFFFKPLLPLTIWIPFDML